MPDPTFTIEIHGYRRNAEGGGKVDAIKELRRLLPGLGLRESKIMVEASEIKPTRIEDATPQEASYARSCVSLMCRVGASLKPAKPPPNTEQIWREVYVAALTTLLHYTDKPSAEAKRLADQAVADYLASQGPA